MENLTGLSGMAKIRYTRRKGRPTRFIWLFFCFLLLALPCSAAAKNGGLLPNFSALVHTALPGEGTEYVLHFKGNEAIATAELHRVAGEELEGFADAGFAKSVVDDAAFRVETYYRKLGFPAARVDYRYDETARPRQVVFSVFEGSRVMVARVEITGNTFFDTPQLLSVNPELAELIQKDEPFPLVEEELSSLTPEMQAKYLEEGFVDCTVSPPVISYEEGKTRAEVIYKVEEGVRYSVGDIVFSGQPSETRKDLDELRKSVVGEFYFQRRRLLLKSRVLEICEQYGYAEPQVDVALQKNSRKGLVDLQVRISPGSRILVGNVIIKGEDRTRRAFIAKQLTFIPGSPYTLAERRRSFRNLYGTGLFSSVSISLAGKGPGEEAERRDVIVEVEERKERQIYFEPGWGSYELLRFASGFKDSNLFGIGRIFRFDTAFSVKGRSLEFGFADPWFLGTKIKADFPVTYRYREEPSFIQEETGVGALFTRNFPKQVSLTAGYRLSRKNITGVDPDFNPQLLDTNYSNGALSLQLVRDSRNDLFFPSSGYRGFVAGELSEPYFGSELSYYRLTGGVRYFFQLPRELVLGVRYATGVILPLGNQVGIPLGERFFNGGENSVRSFRESRVGPVDSNGDALGGTAYNIISVELRKKLRHNFASTFFIDLGNIAPNRSTADGTTPLAADRTTLTRATFSDYFRDMRAGIGVGLQYLLPVGPARLDFAVNPSPDKERSEDDYAVHFSIGMAF